jgi:hypothetical protein
LNNPLVLVGAFAVLVGIIYYVLMGHALLPVLLLGMQAVHGDPDLRALRPRPARHRPVGRGAHWKRCQ